MTGEMKITELCVGPIGTNCYLVYGMKEGELIVIDPGDEAERILQEIRKTDCTLTAILLTHGHSDHIMAVEALKKAYPSLKVYAGQNERAMFENPSLNCNIGFPACHFIPDVFLRDREEMVLAGFRILTEETPGHTKGSVCYFLPEEKVLFSGDTLFFESYGRTDFPTGSEEELRISLHKILRGHEDSVRVLPGHMEKTTIGHEKMVFGVI